MKWENNRESNNVEDAREGSGSGRGFSLGGGKRLSLGTIVVAVGVGWLFGINPLTMLGMLSGQGAQPLTQQTPSTATAPPANDVTARFVSTILADTEDVWREQFKQMGGQYREPKLRLFRGSEPTACGMGQAAMGPFYCPGDLKVYIDLGFYETMRTRLGAPGDFAQAYVIAHEVGHHVQNLLGITQKIDAQRGKISQTQQNALSVRLELQAHHAQAKRQILEAGDLEEALNAASQIGDDTLQRKSQGTIQPETFTHGSSKQRVTWFNRGFQAGKVQQCNTFEGQAQV
jgi:uncharacterized protein